MLGARGRGHDRVCGRGADGAAAWPLHAGGRARWTRRDVGDPRTRWRVGGARLRGSGRGRSRRAGDLNAPGQVVIAGTAAAVEQAGARKSARREASGPAPGQRAVPLCADAAGAGTSRAELRALSVGTPTVPVVANVDARRRKPTDRRRSRRWCDGCPLPSVGKRWCARLSAGVRAYVEVGPGTVLERSGARSTATRVSRTSKRPRTSTR